jgi:hypothetical protein
MTDSEEPLRAVPKTAMVWPTRPNVRTESDDPKVAYASIDTAAPSLIMPSMDKLDPMRDICLRDRELPNNVLSNTESLEPNRTAP